MRQRDAGVALKRALRDRNRELAREDGAEWSNVGEDTPPVDWERLDRYAAEEERRMGVVLRICVVLAALFACGVFGLAYLVVTGGAK